MITGKPLFPGKNVVHQLDLVTDLLGSPSPETIARIRNEKAKRYLNSMRKKAPIPLSKKFPNVDPLALRLLERLIAFDPKDRPSAEEALADPYFYGLANLENEPSTQPIPKIEFEFERRRLTKNDVRELIYREILEYHPQMLQEYLQGVEHTHFMYPSGIDRFKQQFAQLEEQDDGDLNSPIRRQYTSLPRERICAPIDEDADESKDFERRTTAAIARTTHQSPPRSEMTHESESHSTGVKAMQNGDSDANHSARCLLRSDSIASKFVGVGGRRCQEKFSDQDSDSSGVLSQKLAALHS